MIHLAIWIPEGQEEAVDALLMPLWIASLRPTAERPWSSASGRPGTIDGARGRLIGVWRETLQATYADLLALVTELARVGCVVAVDGEVPGLRPDSVAGDQG